MFLPQLKFFQKALVVHPEAAAFLALKRSAHDPVRPGLWNPPGGNVRYGELYHTALEREILGETALSVIDVRVLQVATAFCADDDLHTLFTGHRCRATTDTVALTTEHEAYRWVAEGKFLALSSAPYLERFSAEADL